MIRFRIILSVVFEKNRRQSRFRVWVRRIDNWTIGPHWGRTEGGFLEKRNHLKYVWKGAVGEVGDNHVSD